MIYALFQCEVEYLISQNSDFWDSLYLSSAHGAEHGSSKNLSKASARGGLGLTRSIFPVTEHGIKAPELAEFLWVLPTYTSDLKNMVR